MTCFHSGEDKQAQQLSADRHKCNVLACQSQTLTTFVNKMPCKTSTTSKAARDTIISACGNMVCQDLRPFGGPGFIKLAQAVTCASHTAIKHIHVLLIKTFTVFQASR